jgi:stress response protein YsnF
MSFFGERTIEVTESDEEAVVSTIAHVTGEVVVSKTAEERIETVRDTVRRTEVEVDDDRATGEGMPTGATAGGPAVTPKTSGPHR